jgi:hypothetical protein
MNAVSQSIAQTNARASISYGLLSLLALFFLLGIATGLLTMNFGVKEQNIFSTTELIGFVLSTLLSGASTVLAVVAINLGKASEVSVIERSDQSIKLQQEVFSKTIEALQRIESSTGVTEKRLEDIISGRVGDISERAVEIVSNAKDERRLGFDAKEDAKELEQRLRNSILIALREEREANAENNQRAVDAARRAAEMRVAEAEFATKRLLQQQEEGDYQEKHVRFLRAIVNRGDLKVHKMAHGNTGKTGAALFDALYEVRHNGKTIGVSTFRVGPSSEIVNFIAAAAQEITKGFVDAAIAVAFTESDNSRSALNTINVLSPDVANRLRMVHAKGDFEEAASCIDIDAIGLPSVKSASLAPSVKPQIA